MVGKNWIAIAVTVSVLYAVPFVRGGQSYIYPDPYNYECARTSFDCGEPLCEAIDDCCEPEPWFASSVELLWLNRTMAERQPLMFADVGFTRYSAMDVHQLMFSVEAGVRARAVYGAPNGQTLEMAYAGVYDQLATESRTLDQAAISGLSAAGYQFSNTLPFSTLPDGVITYTALYETDLHSVELNWGLGECCRVRPFIGARWIRLEDMLRVFDAASFDDRSLARMENDLLGGQLGFQVGLWDRGKWFRVEASARSGVFHNYVDLYAVQYAAAVPTTDFKRRLHTTSVAGEINITAIAHLTDCIAITFGYTGFWLGDIGLVPDQSDNFDLATGQGELDKNGVSYQGGHVGIEWVY